MVQKPRRNTTQTIPNTAPSLVLSTISQYLKRLLGELLSVHPYSALALYFHTKPFQKEKLTQIRQEGDRRNNFWQATKPDIKNAINLRMPPFHRKPNKGLGTSLSTGNIGIIFTNLIPIHITFYSDAVFLYDLLPNLIFDFIQQNFILYRSFIVSPSVDSFADTCITDSFKFTRNRTEVQIYK